MNTLAAGRQRSRVASRPVGRERPVSLAEVLDRVLNKGVVVAGEIVITVADIDLVYLAVNVVVCSTETARGARPPDKESPSAAR